MAYEDLLKDSSSPLDNKNYFNLTITDLNISTIYPLQFRWKYEDGTFGPWSVVKTISVPAESFPNVPSTLTVTNNTPGYLEITWNGNTSTGVPLTNFDRVDVYINGAPFDSSKPAVSFFSAGTKTVVAPAGVYIISSVAVSKIGTLSAISTPVTRTVIAIGIPVQAPTLPSGITVATAPFAVTVNWAGTYSTSTFTGFKSIDIYAVSSDLGSSVTSGVSSTNLVGSLTVNDTPNKINISLDNLRQALSLASNSDAYSATIFYYFNATNTDGTKYGSPTYTRINSTSVVPTKANKIDLESGTISIENLVAGNGQFASWLRTGAAGGSRIELSSVSDFANNGYTVQKGLVAYSSGSTELFNLDLDNGSLTINGSGTFSGSLSAASGTFAGALNIGTPVSSLYPFSVSSSGVLRAISGEIGGWTLSDQALYKTSNFSINGNDGVIYVGPSGGTHLRISSSGVASYSGGGPNSVLNIATNGNITATNVNLTGAITATSGSFTGSITSTSGTIAGFTMDADGLINSGSTLRLFAGTTGINNVYSIYTTKPIRVGQFIQIEGSGFTGYSLIGAEGMSLANGGLTINSSGTVTSNATFNSYIYYPGYPVSTSGGAARVNDATTPSSRLVAASGSSIRFKENIVDISEKPNLNPLVLLNLPVRSFTYKQEYLPEDDARYGMDLPGFVAEELEEIYPIAVDRDADGTPQRWNSDFIIPGLLKIIQTQNDSISAINSRLDALEG